MALNRDKLRKIVGGITTADTPEPQATETDPPDAEADQPRASAAGQGRAAAPAPHHAEPDPGERRRFAMRGRPKGHREEPGGKGRKVKVSLFLSETLVNDLYEWAHADRIHPGEMFERALKPFHEREAKRRNTGKE